MMKPHRGRLLVLSQVYVPDPAAVGQYLHDTGAEMARRGHPVTVICSSRGYDDPTRVYPTHETRDGVTILRYSLPFFSKTNFVLRIFGSIWAMLAIFFLALRVDNVRWVLFSTSPPMAGILGVTVAALKHAKSIYWAMDLNPDQLAAMGKLSPRSPIYRAIESANRVILSRTTYTATLDSFMGERLGSNGRRPKRLFVNALWPHESTEQPPDHQSNPFRARHGLQGKFVVMYSGNHSPANPLDTLLQAMLAFKGDDSIRFAFVGGGSEKARVRALLTEHAIRNAIDLPYQPLEDLRYSLSAADVHIVTLGPSMVGVIHPCKVYGAMTVARPILFIGPRPSHVADLMEVDDIGRAIAHGDVAGCIAAIRELQAMGPDLRDRIGQTAMQAVSSRLSKSTLNGRFCDAIEGL
ncbi:MAG: glycosyltransferase family 4 protein [Tepidisphaeraceae bacterium]